MLTPPSISQLVNKIQTATTMKLALFCLLMINSLNIISGSEDVKEFGIHSYSEDSSGSSAAVKLYLWFGFDVYLCTMIPSAIKTKYSCNRNNWLKLDRSCDNELKYKMIINNNNKDAVIVDKISVTLQDNTCYGVYQFCVPDKVGTGAAFNDRLASSGYPSVCPPAVKPNDASPFFNLKTLCIDNENNECSPAKNEIEFDIDEPNKYINNGGWMNGMQVVFATMLISFQYAILYRM